LPKSEQHPSNDRLRVGAVRYLNARPLTFALERFLPEAEIVVDLPSRLADRLAAGRLDVALIPSIEAFRQEGVAIVSDACIACDGPVWSVKLYGRVPPERIGSLALDEGSRTSAALVQILLAEQYGVRPRVERLPIGAPPENATAYAVMVIGDRGMLPPVEPFAFVWDLGEQWTQWTGLPFVFAMWVARSAVVSRELSAALSAARDEGITRLDEIARVAASEIGLPEDDCLSYLRDFLQFRLGPRQLEGLRRFHDLAQKHGLAPDRGGILAPAGDWSIFRPEDAFLGQEDVRKHGPVPLPAHGSSSSTIAPLLEKAVAGRRLTPDEGRRLIASNDLAALARAADAVTRRLHPEPYRTYNVDRNINYTNVCTSGCRFCAFSRTAESADAYVLDHETLFEKIDETVALGGDQILLQGGLHPELSIVWYEELLRAIHERFPGVNIHGLGPPEIDHIARLSGVSLDEVLVRLKGAGLGSLPGGGAEILVDRVRREVSPCKCSADTWLEVCRRWHRLGGRGTATMMFGHVETPAERIEHLEKLRRLQDETAGFTAFIAWTFQPGSTGLAELPKAGAFDYLRTLAVARLYLDNFANLQASWVTQGLKIGQLALLFGANDMGSLMIEENVVAAAGTRFRTTEAAIRRAIEQAGYQPRRRDVFYRLRSQ